MCDRLQDTSTHCNTLQHTKIRYDALQQCVSLWSPCVAFLSEAICQCDTLQGTVRRCSTLQNTATHSNTLQHTKIHCNTLQQGVPLRCCFVRCHLYVLHTGTRCNTVHRTTERCKTLQRTTKVCYRFVRRHLRVRRLICT